MGTGNDFAHAIGMADDLGAAARQIAAGRAVVRCDLGHVRWTDASGERHERRFMNCLGAGFDAHAAALAAQKKWLGGQAAYLVAVMRTLWLWRRPRVRARVRELVGAGDADAPDGLDLDGPLFLCEFGNGHSVGGGFLLTPDAVLTDGLLDVCHVRHITTRRALRLLPTSLTGGHVSAPEVTMARVAGVGLSAPRGLPLQADGEILTYDAVEVEVEVEPAALAVRVGGGMRDEG